MKLLLIISFLGISLNASAQIWKPVLRFAAGDVEGLGWDSSGRIFIGTDSGSYLSTDNGDHWHLDSIGFAADEAFCFTTTPARTVLVGTEVGAVLRSTDEGEHWMHSSAGIPDSATIHTIFTDRKHNILAASADNGVYFSSDDGLHWQSRNTGLSSLTCGGLVETPNGYLYVGLSGSIAQSTDEGLHWNTSYTTDTKDAIISLASDSAGNIFAGTSSGQILRSLNGGASWDPTVPLTAFPVRCISIYQTKIFAGTFGGGISLSTDLGGHWTVMNDNLFDNDRKVLCSAVTLNGYFFFGTLGAKLYRSELPLSSVAAQPGNSPEQLTIASEPISHQITLTFRLPNAQHVTLQIFDIAGREVARLWDGHLSEGEHTVFFDCGSSAKGVYFAVLTTPTGTVRTGFFV